MPKTNKPAISVVMPVYNASETLPLAIDSILGQTFTNFELIMVDDCSKDDSLAVLQAYAKRDDRITVLRNEQNVNIVGTLNKGIAAASGTYIARMDADDWSTPDRLQLQYEYLEAHPETVICGGHIITCDNQMKPQNVRRYNLGDAAIRAKLFRYAPYAHGSIMFRTETFNKTGGYNKLLPVCEDYDLYFQLGMFGAFGNVDKVVYKLRFHAGSISASNSRKQELYTLYVRIKAMAEYGYSSTFGDKAYLILQYLSMFIIPQKYKLRLFNALRSDRGSLDSATK